MVFTFQSVRNAHGWGTRCKLHPFSTVRKGYQDSLLTSLRKMDHRKVNTPPQSLGVTFFHRKPEAHFGILTQSLAYFLEFLMHFLHPPSIGWFS